MNKFIAICIAVTTTSITLYCNTGVKENAGREAYIFNQTSQFDWSKLRSNPSNWLDRNVTLEGWLQVYVDADGKVNEIWIRETFESMQYAFNRRSVELSKVNFLKAVSREGISADAMAVMLSGKPIKINGVLKECADPEELGEIAGEIKVQVISDRRPGILSNFHDEKKDK